MIRTLLVSICLAASSAAAAKGAHTSGPVEHVSGYTRADGTQVAPYDRAAPGYGVHNAGSSMGSSSNGMVGGSGGSAKLDDPMSFGGVGKQEAVSAASGPCVYKGVMTDAEIATCRAASAADAKRSPGHRRTK
jgi:hypothetical protein